MYVLRIRSWFELEWAEAQVRLGKPGLAIKKALAVHTHFEDFVEDQFDFHTYCMRKVCVCEREREGHLPILRTTVLLVL